MALFWIALGFGLLAVGGASTIATEHHADGVVDAPIERANLRAVFIR